MYAANITFYATITLISVVCNFIRPQEDMLHSEAISRFHRNKDFVFHYVRQILIKPLYPQLTAKPFLHSMFLYRLLRSLIKKLGLGCTVTSAFVTRAHNPWVTRRDTSSHEFQWEFCNNVWPIVIRVGIINGRFKVG